MELNAKTDVLVYGTVYSIVVGAGTVRARFPSAKFKSIEGGKSDKVLLVFELPNMEDLYVLADQVYIETIE